MRTLIIPDVHNKIGIVEKILATAKYDRVVFLGDFFDDFHDTPYAAGETAEWLRRRVDTTEDVFLLGNHDVSYRFPFDDFTCSGFTTSKLKAINAYMKPKHWARFQLWVEIDGWILSHAGFHLSLAHPELGFDRRWMSEKQFDVLDRAALEWKCDPWLMAGRARWGLARFGGVTWLDWDREFQPVPGMNQIVGHSPHDDPKRQQFAGRPGANRYEMAILSNGGVTTYAVDGDGSSDNWCLDTHLKHYAVIQDGRVEIHNV